MFVFVCVCVSGYDLETSKRGGEGPIWAAMPQENVVRRTYLEN